MTKTEVVRVPDLDWPALGERLDRWGFAVTPPLLDEEQCRELSELFEVDDAFRSTIVMSRHAFGEGTYRYFTDPLPAVVQQLRVELYGPLAQIANRWAADLGTKPFPDTLDGLVDVCAAAGQHRPTPLLLRYWADGYNCLHQDLYGEVAFPLQVTIMLSVPDEDFTGGENVLVEQRPRAQSRPVVARLERGQALLFPTRDRPVPGKRGPKRVAMRHGVSTVHTGERTTLGIIFHNAE
ncbi:MAG TPA: 2OG-Fe(II) oxygenase [Acidimicrobiia bacterium]|nr:2OG-Fe(II) oxygenase [Acidimicrobiia bacterium]